MKRLNGVVSGAVLSLMCLSACSMNGFETISLSEKQAALKETTILKNAVLATPRDAGQSLDENTDRNNGDLLPTARFKIPVATTCSNFQSQQNAGINLAAASSVKVVIYSNANGDRVPVCANDNIDSIRSAVLKRDLENQRHVTLFNCELKVGQPYEVTVTALSSTSTVSDSKSIIVGGQAYRFTAPGDTDAALAPLPLLVNINNSTVNNDECDRRASPLIIQTKKDEHLSFSKESERPVFFDLLGQNAFRFGRESAQKIALSWIEQPSFMFLVRPERTKNGTPVINGIDQLFGDNSKGPDEKTSENGFAALKKFDTNHDGFITRQDPVFSELGLWSDTNLDGKATLDELKPLADLKIQIIDLGFDPSFKETDAQTGNEIVYKSVVKTSDQALLLMFDLWFDLSHIVN